MGDEVGRAKRKPCTRADSDIYHPDFRGALTPTQSKRYCIITNDAPKTNVNRMMNSRRKLVLIGKINSKCLKADVTLQEFPSCVCKEAKRLA